MAGPLDFPDPLAFLDRDPLAPRRRQAAYPPLSEPETESAISRLTQGGLSGLGYVGSLLDKMTGARALRGTLGGHPRELLSLLPFSDTAGITAPEQITSGEDLLRRAGYDPSQGNWFERNLVGPGVEIGLDPATYLGGIGPLTRLGKGLARQGQGTKGLLSAVRSGERSLHPLVGAVELGARGLGLSTKAEPVVQRAAASAVEGAGKLGKAINVGVLRKLPLVAPVEDLTSTLGGQARLVTRSLFDRKAGPIAEPTMQAAHEFTRIPQQERRIEAARRVRFDLEQRLAPVLAAGASPEAISDYVTQLGERIAPSHLLPPDPSLAPHLPVLDEVGRRLARLYAAFPGAEKEVGVKSPLLSSIHDLGYMTQRMVPTQGVGGGGLLARLFPTAHPSQLRRKEIFDVPGGRVQLKGWIKDPAMSGAARTLPPDVVRQLIEDEHMARAYHQTTGSIPLTFPAEARKKARGLADYLGNVKPEFVDIPGRATPTVPFFDPDVLANFMARATRSANTVSGARAIHDVIGRVGVQGIGDVPATTVLKQAGLRGEGAYRSALEALRQDPADIIANAAAAAPDPLNFDPVRALRDELKTYLLPRREASSATRAMKRFVTPEEIGPVKRLADSILNLTKAGLYSVFPASHGRNIGSIGVENALGGTMPWSSAYPAAARARSGHGIETGLPALAGMALDRQRLKLLRSAYAHGLIGSPQGEFQQTLGLHLPEVGSGNPALPKPGILRSALPWFNVPGALKDPFGVAGVGWPFGAGVLRGDVPTRLVDTNPFVRAGRGVGTATEETGRLAQFLGLQRRGYTPRAAANLVERTHFDYGNLSDFEKQWMKRIIPFYCVPVSHEILTQRGWMAYDRLVLGELVMAYNHETGEMSWEPLQEVATFDFDGELLTIKRGNGRKHHDNATFLFTEDHRWPVETTRSFVKGKWYGGERKIVKASELNTLHQIPMTGEFRGRASLLTERQAAILGWVVTDGYFRWRGGYCEMLVYQSPGKYLKEVVELLGTEPRPPHPDTGVVAVPVALEDMKSLVVHFHSKADLPGIVGQLSREVAEVMWDAMFKAEGSVSSHGEANFAQDPILNKDVLDSFQILCLMTGRTGNLSSKGLNIRTSKFIRPALKSGASGIGREYYRGTIWCPRTRLGTWVMRHNGCVIITGNTFTRRNIPKQISRAVTSPLKVSGPIRVAGAQDEGEGYVPQYLRPGLAVPLGGTQPGTQRYLSQLGLPFEEAFSRLKIGVSPADTAKRTLEGLLGTLRPELRAPLEVATGRQFFTGRDLADLHVGKLESFGGLLDDESGRVLSQLITATPLSRSVSTLNRMLDERKGLATKALSLATGVKLTDVESEKWRAIDARHRLEELMSLEPQLRQSTDFYPSPEAKATGAISPDQAYMLQLYAAMKLRAREAAAQKRVGVRVGAR